MQRTQKSLLLSRNSTAACLLLYQLGVEVVSQCPSGQKQAGFVEDISKVTLFVGLGTNWYSTSTICVTTVSAMSCKVCSSYAHIPCTQGLKAWVDTGHRHASDASEGMPNTLGHYVCNTPNTVNKNYWPYLIQILCGQW
jgi:hypothetical protein